MGWGGDAHGTDSMTSLVMDGPKRVEAFFSQHAILQPGESESGALSRVAGYWTYVPVGATELVVDVETQGSDAGAILAVSQAGEIWVDEKRGNRRCRIPSECRRRRCPSRDYARIVAAARSRPLLHPGSGGPPKRIHRHAECFGGEWYSCSRVAARLHLRGSRRLRPVATDVRGPQHGRPAGVLPHQL